MPSTWTAAELWSAPTPLFIAENSGWRARYTFAGSPLTLSAFARLLAVVLSRTDCALIPEPAMSKILNEDMASTPLLARDGGHQGAELRIQEGQRRLVTHGVFGECRLFELD